MEELVWHTLWTSDDVPRILTSVAEFAASDTCTQTVIADTDRFVFESVGEVILPFGHGANEDADTFRGAEIIDVVPDSDHVSIETQRDLPTVGW